MKALRVTTAAIVVLVSIAGCCERRGSQYFFVERPPHAAFDDVVWNSEAHVWSGDPHFVRVLVPDHLTPSREMLEVYQADGTQLEIAGVRSAEDPGDGCPQYFVEYRLELSDGLYTIVHRLSTAPAGFTTPDAARDTLFDGEAALVTMIRVGEPERDAATADAGR